MYETIWINFLQTKIGTLYKDKSKKEKEIINCKESRQKDTIVYMRADYSKYQYWNGRNAYKKIFQSS